jgi:uncharacterized membrane protein YgcG
VILILDDLHAVIKTYAQKVVQEWKLGGTRENGVLILIVVKKREVRIEVGSGLMDKLTPALCGTIIDNEIVPAFKDKDYDAGTLNTASAVLGGIYGKYPQAESYPTTMIVMWIASIAIIVASVVGLFSKYFSAAFYGGLLPFYLIVGITINWWTVAAYAAGFPLLRFIIVKSKVPQLKFGKNASAGSRSEDLHDKMSRRQTMFDSSSSDSGSGSSGSSSDSGGSSGRW